MSVDVVVVVPSAVYAAASKACSEGAAVNRPTSTDTARSGRSCAAYLHGTTGIPVGVAMLAKLRARAAFKLIDAT